MTVRNSDLKIRVALGSLLFYISKKAFSESFFCKLIFAKLVFRFLKVNNIKTANRVKLFSGAQKWPEIVGFIQNMSQALSKCLSKWINWIISNSNPITTFDKLFLFGVPMNI